MTTQTPHQAMMTWAQVVGWLTEVEQAVPDAPQIAGIDADEIDAATDAVRTARLAVAALVGSYATEANTAQPPTSPAPPTAAQMWSQRQQVHAARPHIPAPEPAAPDPIHYPPAEQPHPQQPDPGYAREGS